MRKTLTIVLLFELLLLLCQVATPVVAQSGSEVTRDYWPTEEWRTSTPEEQGMNSTILNQISDSLESSETEFHSFIVIRNGYIVYEEYPHSVYQNDSKHITMGVTKSITSALIGVALEQEYIESLDEYMLDYFSDKNITNWDSRKEDITIEQLLTMTSGLDWREYLDFDDDLIHMWFHGDWVEYVLNQPLMADPGEQFEYCTGGSVLLSAIVNISTGQDTYEFALDNLFNPIGIEEAYWPADDLGVYNGGTDIGITPRDMARFGYLYLNNGTWDNEQIISAEYIEESTSTQVSIDQENGYGYQWWTSQSMNSYSAHGWGGQNTIVIPEYDIVVVTTAKAQGAAEYDSNCTCNTFYSSPCVDQTITEFIIPSIDGYLPQSEDTMIPVLIGIAGISVVALVVIFYVKRS